MFTLTTLHKDVALAVFAFYEQKEKREKLVCHHKQAYGAYVLPLINPHALHRYVVLAVFALSPGSRIIYTGST